MHLEGFDELERKLARLDDAVKGHALLQAVEAGADVLEPDMRARAARRTGQLAASIETKSRIVKPTRAETSTGPSKKAWYGKFIELGTRKRPARPFMRPALFKNRQKIIAAIAAELRARLMRVTGG